MDNACGRFREIFRALDRDHGQDCSARRPAAEALHRLPNEAPPTGRPVNLGPARLPLRLMIVPGLGASMLGQLGQPLLDAAAHVRRLSYDVELLEVEGLSSSRRNAELLRQMLARRQRPPGEHLVMLGYSKGAVDVLEALHAFPEVAAEVTAFVSLAGPIGGSVLADRFPETLFRLLRLLPGARFKAGDHGGLRSLGSGRRRAWLERSELPKGIRYYSLISFTSAERISAVLRPSYRRLRPIDRNDGQMLRRDQILPGSRLLACLDADHWAIALPLARRHPALRWLGLNHNDFPREIMLEAILKTIEEDLLEDAATA